MDLVEGKYMERSEDSEGSNIMVDYSICWCCMWVPRIQMHRNRYLLDVKCHSNACKNESDPWMMREQKMCVRKQQQRH